MDNQIHNQIVSFIWGIADDCLRDVILPMTVIRRLDAMLEDTKEAVLDMKKKLDELGIDEEEVFLGVKHYLVKIWVIPLFSIYILSRHVRYDVVC